MARLFSLAICHFAMAVFGQGWEPATLRYGVSDGISDAGFYAVLVDRHNQLFRLFEDEFGRIWCMGGENQLSYFENDTIKHYRFNQVLRDSLPPGQALTDFTFDKSGNLHAVFRNGKHRSIRIDSLGNYSYQPIIAPQSRINIIECRQKQLVSCQFPKGFGSPQIPEAANHFRLSKGWDAPREIPTQTVCRRNRIVRSERAVRLKDGRQVVNAAWACGANWK